MSSFFDTIHCTSAVHCRICREGKLAKLTRKYGLADDFPCPFGVTLENVDQRSSMPPLLARAKNLTQAVGQAAKAVVKRAAGGKAPVLVSAEELARRRAICEAPCEWWRPAKKSCGRCGCRYQVKVTLADWHCPVKKW